jgi:hypothetical protein
MGGEVGRNGVIDGAVDWAEGQSGAIDGAVDWAADNGLGL